MTIETRFKVGDLVKINPDHPDNTDVQLGANLLKKDIIYTVTGTRDINSCIRVKHSNIDNRLCIDTSGFEFRFMYALTPIDVGDLS